VFQRYFEHGAAIAGRVSTSDCCAIDVATSIHIQAGRRVGSVKTLESVQHGVVAPGIEPEHAAAAADSSASGIGRIAAEIRRAIKIAQVVTDHTTERSKSFCASSEVVENGLFAAAVDFENSSVTKTGIAGSAAAVAGDAVDVARVVCRKPAIRKRTAVFAFEGMNDGEFAIMVDFEDSSASDSAGESLDNVAAEGA